MGKEELFRQCLLSHLEVQGYKDGAAYNLMIVEKVIEKNGWCGDYIEWLSDQGSKIFRRKVPFPTGAIIAMLD